MVAVVIFAMIATISYRIITSLVKTKQIVDETQDKWGSLSLFNANLERSVHRMIPLTCRDGNGQVLPAIYGKNNINGLYDGQLEMTLSGFLGNDIVGIKPPKRVAYRFIDNNLYLVTWPVLNRAINTVPEIDLLISNVENFEVSYLYQDNKWYPTWPPEGGDISSIPMALKVNVELMSGESVERQWSLTK